MPPQSSIGQYIVNLQKEFSTGHAQEHSFRPALKTLFESIAKLKIVNEPKGSAHGRPDFIFLKGDVPIAWVEAKDLHVNLDKVEKSEQMARYFGYPNLILTNGLEFRFFKNGQKYGDGIVLASKNGSAIENNDKAFRSFESVLRDFIAEPMDSIRSAKHLAKIMGGKAQRLRDEIVKILDPEFRGNKGDVESVMQVLKASLIHDLTVPQFADLYAQTLVYGLFVARYHDNTKDTFSRAEARDRIPATNHLLQQFFDHIAGTNFVKELSFVVDELCDVFVHADVRALVHGLYLQMNLEGETHDPIIHFYEDFLKEYDPKLRMSRGVFYTPLPVVRYIVRSVDALLKKHFGLEDGLADRTTIEWKHTVQGKKTKQTIDRVQILDPAAGTGTFLNEVVRHIHRQFATQQGAWQTYVEQHLLPRLNGFELMMASYTIAHLKVAMTLAETGVKSFKKRLRIFLTNSLEEAPKKDDSLFKFIGFQEAITEEAEAAAEVKRELPIMVVLGNPPYSVSSQNASTEMRLDGKKHKTWIGALLDDYKKNLNEKKLNLDDDYIKFIRFAHHLIEKNGQGIAAMITNNSFLDGITHRRMRESLLQTFDHIYVLDLHGNSKRKEMAPDGGKDENVFDIQQGVGITLFVKTEKSAKKNLGQVHHIDLHGKQSSKYEWLEKHHAQSTQWKELDTPAPAFFFVPKDLGLQKEYDQGLRLSDLFSAYGSGVKTERDHVSIHWQKNDIIQAVNDFRSSSVSQLRTKYDLQKDSRDWTVAGAINDVMNHKDESLFQPILYRIFDVRYTWYSGQTRGFIGTPGYKRLCQMLKPNLGLIFKRQAKESKNYSNFFVSNSLIIDGLFAIDPLGREVIAPLYLYPVENVVTSSKRMTNLKIELLKPILNNLAVVWIEDGIGNGKDTCGPEDIFDYIYAILHCPAYRQRYKEFLKIDFPRVPFTANARLFWKLVALGREIRGLHLLEPPILKKLRTTFPANGSGLVEKVSFEGKDMGKVWINKTQYFGDVPKIAWEFFIGGYQPAQKWLKDRKSRTLSSDDIEHWQKIIIALIETDRLMKEIDAAVGKEGGWPLK